MNLKKVKIIGGVVVFLLTFLLHFIYEAYPNFIFSVIAPVNESIWEHMKLIYSSFIIYGIIEFLIIKRKVKFNNYLFQLFLVPVLGIISYLIIYLPVYHIFGENLIFSIILLGIIIVLEEVISYFILKLSNIKKSSLIGLVGIVLGYILFFNFTYYPPHNYLFIDIQTNSYGINK